MAKQHLGGSFAPPLTDALLADYREMINGLPESFVKDILLILLNCCEKWWGLPDSLGAGSPHPVGGGITMVPLSDENATKLFDHIPWKEELDGMKQILETIPSSDKKLRDCAFHLLWHVIELEEDREPITIDKLPSDYLTPAQRSALAVSSQ